MIKLMDILNESKYEINEYIEPKIITTTTNIELNTQFQMLLRKN